MRAAFANGSASMSAACAPGPAFTARKWSRRQPATGTSSPGQLAASEQSSPGVNRGG